MMTMTPTMAPLVLQGLSALVTGAGQGNGRAIAMGLAVAGARVWVTDRDAASALSVAAEIVAAGGQAQGYGLDVTDAQACSALAAQLSAEVGLDILVNNAGIIIREGMDSPRAQANLAQTLQVNVMGSFLPTQAWLPALQRRRGVVINIGSIASFVGIPGVLGYSPSKGAVKQMTQAMAVELAPHGVRVNAIAPGVIETPMTAHTRASPGRLDRFLSRTPMGRVGQPEELVGPVVFLASAMASYVTGVTLPVDGGYLAA